MSKRTVHGVMPGGMVSFSHHWKTRTATDTLSLTAVDSLLQQLSAESAEATCYGCCCSHAIHTAVLVLAGEYQGVHMCLV